MPPELKSLLLMALLNPATLAAGYLLGRNADQPAKIPIAALVAAIAGTALTMLADIAGVLDGPPAYGGVFTAASVVGAVWAWLGYVVGAARRRHGG